jgi:F-type H+-transporting ATPase subunit delta
MHQTTVARNYAEALLSLARKAQDVSGWGGLINEVADAIRRDERLRHFLESPRISVDQKNDVLMKAFQDRMPRLFVRFLQRVVSNRRQVLISHIAVEYMGLVDEIENRIHANVTVAKETSSEDEEAIARQLGRVFGKEVVPHVTVNPGILGGLVVRVGDTVIDGSVRRRLNSLRNRLVYGARA